MPRLLNPIWTHRDVRKLSLPAQMHFMRWILSAMDDAGNGPAEPESLYPLLYPYERVKHDDIARWHQEATDAGLWATYRVSLDDPMQNCEHFSHLDVNDERLPWHQRLRDERRRLLYPGPESAIPEEPDMLTFIGVDVLPHVTVTCIAETPQLRRATAAVPPQVVSHSAANPPQPADIAPPTGGEPAAQPPQNADNPPPECGQPAAQTPQVSGTLPPHACAYAQPRPQPPAQPLKEEEKEDKKRRENTRAAARERSLTDFENWWENDWLGQKADKQTAQKRWLRLNPDGSQTETLRANTQDYFRRRAAAEAAGSWVPEIPMPKTFLNQARWTDRFDAPKTSRSAAPAQIVPRPASVPKPTAPQPDPPPLPDSLLELPDDWSAALAALEAAVDPENFRTWLATLEYLGQDDTTLYLAAPSDFNARKVQRDYADRILEAYDPPEAHPGYPCLDRLDIRVNPPSEDEDDEEPCRGEPECSSPPETVELPVRTLDDLEALPY